MLEISVQILVILFLLIIAYLYSKDDVDATGFTLFFAIIACILTGWVYNLEPDAFFLLLPFSSLVYVIFMDIFIKLLIREHIFEYMALKIIRFTKSNIRLFFYLLCIVCSFVSGLMEDVSVAIIMFPIIFRATKIIDIESRPFIFGATASIIIGNLLTPFATPINILISEAFNLDIGWFLKYLFVIYAVSMFVILFYIDRKYIRHIPPLDMSKLNILLEIMDPGILIQNKRKFYRYLIYLIAIIIGLLINFYTYVFIAIFVIIIALFEERNLTEFFSKINWSVPLIFIGFFLLIGCIQINGTINKLEVWFRDMIGGNALVGAFIVFFFASIIASLISRSLATITFITVLGGLFVDLFPNPQDQTILLVALLMGLHLGGSFLPQATSFVLKMIEQARDRKVKNIHYKTVKEVLGKFTFMGIIVAVVYLLVLGAILGLY